MANVLGNYNPSFFANEALIQLFKTLGMAARVHRGAEEDRNSNGRSLGDTINIRRPSTFTAEQHVAGTGSSTQDVVGNNVAITLDQHYEVKFKLSDVELAYSGERIINEHIVPAAYAMGDNIDAALYTLGAKVGPKTTVSGTAAASFITGPRKVLAGNAVPMDQNIHYMVDTGMEAALLDLGIFHEARIVGAPDNQAALMNGSLGRRFGVEVFTSQNADTAKTAISSTGTASAATGDLLGATVGATAANVNTMSVDSFGTIETVSIGDVFNVAGDTTDYILTADVTFSGGAGTLTFFPTMRKNVAALAIVTLKILTAIDEAAHLQNLMFHRNAFALAFAPLPRTGDGVSASIDTVTDPISGISIRARMWYDGTTATNFVALDALYGVQVLDPMLATRIHRATTVYPA